LILIERRDSCYLTFAKDLNKTDLCKKLSLLRSIGECYLYFAKKNNDLSLCQELENVRGITIPAYSECIFFFAKKYNNKNFCKKIFLGNLRLKCLKEVTGEIQDSDFDGLSDDKEKEIGTDPFNPDTDGDGYFDGTEVEKGYNPLVP